MSLLQIFVLLALLCTSLVLSAEQRSSKKNPRLAEQKKSKQNEELEAWEAPENLKKAFPYYFAGYDYEDRPVWVFEYGKWDLKSYFEKGGKHATELFEKYSDQFWNRMHNSPEQRPKDPENPVDGWVCICDLENYDLTQFSYAQALQQTLRMARGISSAGENLSYAFVINANYFGETMINLLRPILGGVFATADVLGTNKKLWLPKMLKKIPRDALPEWYGGFKNYTPIAVLG